jgi:Lrp/AsnC family leucine-responsive transcriptional regulator
MSLNYRAGRGLSVEGGGSDMDAYQELLLNRITRIQGVTGVHSSFVLRRVVDKTALPV